MEKHLILTMGLLFLAHFISEYTPIRLFNKDIKFAKINKLIDENSKYVCIHPFVSGLYKVLAIIASYWIFPVKWSNNLLFIIVFIIILLFFYIIEVLAHTLLDLCKYSINVKFKLTPENDKYWLVIGIEQFIHFILMLGVCYLLYC
jgi:hypothetical protein